MLTKFFQLIDIFITWQTINWAKKYYQLKSGDVVLDIGGYFGGFAIYAAKKVGENGRVICFEPDPRNIKILEKRIKKKKFKNITIIQKALSDRVGEINLLSNYAFSSIIKSNNLQEKMKVETSTLDKEMQKLNISEINFMKMNIEGAEIEAVKGAEQTLLNTKHLVIASHKRDQKDTANALESVIKKHGFQTRISCFFHKNLYGDR